MTKKSVQLSLLSNQDKLTAEDQIKQLQREVDYDLRDFTIDYIVQQFTKDFFYIPPYQREFIWRDKHRVKFIESVILGLPIPFMFVADMEDGRLEIVDGAQRIQTLEAFLNGDLVLSGLEKLPSLNGFSFSDLPLSQQRKFMTRALRMIVLDDKTTDEIRHEIFNRINTTGERARSSEIRKGAYAGNFMRFIAKCSQNATFIKLCPISGSLRKRGEAEELIVRFFAYADRYKHFKHDVDKFLDKYVQDNRESFDKPTLEVEFNRMLSFVNRYFENGFAKSANAKSTPRVRFEAIAVGAILALRENSNLVPAPLAWLDSNEFKIHTTTHASNSGPRLQGRIEYVRDMLLAGAN